MNNALAGLLRAPSDAPPPVRLDTGIVTALGPPVVVTYKGTPVENPSTVKGYVPALNDVVVVAVKGHALYVLGTFTGSSVPYPAAPPAQPTLQQVQVYPIWQQGYWTTVSAARQITGGQDTSGHLPYGVDPADAARRSWHSAVAYDMTALLSIVGASLVAFVRVQLQNLYTYRAAGTMTVRVGLHNNRSATAPGTWEAVNETVAAAGQLQWNVPPSTYTDWVDLTDNVPDLTAFAGFTIDQQSGLAEDYGWAAGAGDVGGGPALNALSVGYWQ